MIEFMSDWDRARRFVKREENFLDLGISYSYDSMTNFDKIQLENGKPLMLRESSSGVQSLLPNVCSFGLFCKWSIQRL